MSDTSLLFIDSPTSDSRVVAARIQGQLTAGDMAALIERLNTVVAGGEKARLLIDMQDYDGFEFGVIREKLRHMGMLWKAFDKYAVVGAARWMEVWIDIVNPITPQQIKHFSVEDLPSAWNWLVADGD